MLLLFVLQQFLLLEAQGAERAEDNLLAVGLMITYVALGANKRAALLGALDVVLGVML